jgi:CRP-like cAMP-binding protein
VVVNPDELVSRWPVFSELELVTRAELLRLLKPRSAVPGERLIQAGEQGREAFFLSSGEVEVAVRGRKIRLGPGTFFGEMALLSGAPRSADVTALDYCQLFTLGKEDFDRFLQTHPDLRAKIDVVAKEREAMNRQADPAAPPAGISS